MGAGKRQNEGEENLELQFRLLSSYRSFPKFCMEIYLQGILAGGDTQKAHEGMAAAWQLWLAPS